MSAAEQLRDVRRGADEPGVLEFTLSSGEVYFVACYGVHEQEKIRVQGELLAALGASGIRVVVGS
jgi:hypothetical protein